MYMFKGLCSALDWYSDELLFVLGLDADCAHRIIMCISLDYRLYGSWIQMG
jgi:hypothetical protein